VTRVLAACIVVVAWISSARAEPCLGAPARCKYDEGTRLLSASPADPRAAAERFLASYLLDPQTDTLARHALALRMDHQYAASYDAWKKVEHRAERELADAKLAASTSQQVGGDAAKLEADRAAIARARNRLDNVHTQLAELAPRIARVRIRFPDGANRAQIVVSRKGFGDVDATVEITINAGTDSLIFKYPNGTVKELHLVVGAGQIETIVAPGDDSPPSVDREPSADTGEAPIAPRSRSLSPQRWLAIGAGGAGFLVLGAAITFQVQSSSAWDDAVAAGCTDATCPAGRATELGERSNTRAKLALASAITSAVLVGAGVGLWLLDRRAPAHHARSAWQVAPVWGGGLAAWTHTF
jgi:hypothetical protein